MNFLGKKLFLVGFVFLVLAGGAFASMCMSPLDVARQDISEKGGVKLVFVSAELCHGVDPYLQNQGTETATKVSLLFLIDGKEVSNRYLDTRWAGSWEIELSPDENSFVVGLEDMYADYNASSITVVATSEQGATTTAEFSWPSGSGASPVEPLMIVYLILLIALPIAFVFLLFYKAGKYRKVALVLFVAWGLLFLFWLAVTGISYD